VQILTVTVKITIIVSAKTPDFLMGDVRGLAISNLLVSLQPRESGEYMGRPSTKQSISLALKKRRDLPATRHMLSLTRQELKADLTAVRTEIKQMHFDMKQFETRIDLRLEKEFSEMRSMIHRQNVLIEDQNANNRIVLEGLQALWQRQDRMERA
jgi:hypothetical protein